MNINTFFTLLISFFALSLVVAQGSTTLEEYNYIKKEIMQAVGGEGIYKKGYTIEYTHGMYRDTSNGDGEVYAIVTRDIDNSIAGIGCYSYDGLEMCIPINNKELMLKYKKDIQQLSQHQIQYYAYGLSNALVAIVDALNHQVEDYKTEYYKSILVILEMYDELEKYSAGREYVKNSRLFKQLKMERGLKNSIQKKN